MTCHESENIFHSHGAVPDLVDLGTNGEEHRTLINQIKAPTSYAEWRSFIKDQAPSAELLEDTLKCVKRWCKRPYNEQIDNLIHAVTDELNARKL